MTTDTTSTEQNSRKRKVIYRNPASPLYGLGFLGALVYYIGHATTFWLGVLGFFKAMFWPAMLVYELLKYLNM